MRKIYIILFAIVLLVNVAVPSGFAQGNEILQKVSVKLTDLVGNEIKGAAVIASRITSYNVCYTKLLRLNR